jgi:hypothetical protein
VPEVLAPLVPLAVALLLLLIAYGLVVVLTPIIEGILREVPLVGGFLADKARHALDWIKAQLTGWFNSTVSLLVRWFTGLENVWRAFVEATDGYLVALPEHLAHIVQVTVPALIREALHPVRAEVAALTQQVDALPADLADVFTKPLSDFRGIEHGVRGEVDALARTLRNVDLPDIRAEAISGAADLALGAEREVADLRDRVDADLRWVIDQLGKLPLAQLLTQLAALSGTAALLQVITAEAGLDNAECRSKVRQICATDPNAWQALLEVAGFAALWAGLDVLIAEMQDFAGELLPLVEDALSGG